MAYTATTVLPLPTSPCKSRFIGSGPARSAAISAIACPLPGGQLEGKEPAYPGVDPGRGLQRRGLPLLVLLLPLDRQRKLQNEQLLIDQPPPGLLQALLVGGKMDLRQRLPERPEPVGLQIAGGKDLLQHARVLVQRPADDLPHLPLQQPFGQRIDRQNLGGRLVFLGVEDIDPRMVHLPDQPLVLRLAGEHDPLAELEAVAHEGLVEPEGPQVSGFRADGDAQHAAADARAAEVDVIDHAADALELALFEPVDRPLVAEVLVIAGEAEEHVADGLEPEPFEQFGPGRPDPLEELDGRGELLFGC